MSSSVPMTNQTRPKNTRSRGGCVRCRRRRQKCDQSKPFCDRCVEAGSPCKYEVHLSWGGRSFRKSTFGECLQSVQKLDNATDGDGFVYGMPQRSLDEDKRPSTGSHRQPSSPSVSRRTSSPCAYGEIVEKNSKSAQLNPVTGSGTQLASADDNLALISQLQFPQTYSHLNAALSDDFDAYILPQPQNQISFLPPMAQYLFQFYLSETIRLTVPSSYAKEEICRFVVPMSLREPSLLYAVMAFAAGHLEAIGKVPGNSQHLIDRLHWNSIRHLRQLLDASDSVSQAVALATTRTLCQAQIYGGTSLWRIHLDGARAILKSSHVNNQLISGGSHDQVNSEFLSSWFNNAEALAALSPTGLFSDQLQASSHSDSGVFFDIFGGVMSDLPALFKAVGALVKENRKRTASASQSTAMPDMDILHEADRLTQEILSRLDRDTAENLVCQSNMFLSLSANEIKDYALSNAGFLYTAHLHIYCGVRALSHLSSEVQLCVDQIIRCAQEISCDSGLSPRVLLVAPLFTAGLCAVGNARESIRSALVDIGKWMRTPHLSKTLALLEKVWLKCPDNSPDAWARGGFETIKFDFLPY